MGARWNRSATSRRETETRVRRPRHQEDPRPLWRPLPSRRSDHDGTRRLVRDRTVLRPQVALFVNESTRLPVFVPLAPAATIVDRFVTDLGVTLAAHGVDPRFVAAELAEMTEHRLAKTASRSVIGTITDFAYLAEGHREQDSGVGLVELSLSLSQTPCGPLRDLTGFPDLELKALVERELDAR